MVKMGGRGASGRSKQFLDVAYKNLGFSPGFDDHIAALKQLGVKYPYMDLSRVGATGHSAGGYAAARAVLLHPEIYKVAVASAGNHDPRLGPAGFHELWMGPIGDHYWTQSNMALAKNLKGKLLLIHGELDAHVPVANSLRLAASLMEAEKDFEMVLIPGATHLLGDNRYAIRRTWDFFVRHLMGVEPPQGFTLPNLQRVR